MNVISSPATIQLKRRRRFGLIVALALLAAGVGCALAFAIDWNSTKSQKNSTSRAGVLESAGGWSGLVDPTTGIPVSAGVVGLPTATVQPGVRPADRSFDRGVMLSAGGWSGLVDPATGIPLSAGVVGLPTSAVQARLKPYAR
jgi:hypothetical protein